MVSGSPTRNQEPGTIRGGNASSNKTDTVDVYKRVTSIIWQRLSPTFGIRTINAIAKNAVVRRGQVHPYLTHLKVSSEDGIEWAEFEAHLDEVTEEDIGQMLADLMDEFFDALAILIGRLVVGKIFAEAEAEIRIVMPEMAYALLLQVIHEHAPHILKYAFHDMGYRAGIQMMRTGIFTGFLSELLQREVVCEEVACQFRGDPTCEFVVLPYQE